MMGPMKLPAVFVSHGAPTIALEDVEATRAWEALAASLPRPRAVLAVSAHWDTAAAVASAAPAPATIHDFAGFPRELYAIRYPAPGDPALAARAAALLAAAGLACAIDPARGLDHGAWVPLMRMYPQADVPVVQLSVQSALGARHHHALGRALAPLRDEGVLVLGSGGMVHNLRDLDWHGRSARPFPWAVAFNGWVAERAASGATAELLDYRSLAPEARRAHPTEEHFVPFFVALGAGGPGARRLDLGFDLGSLSMDAWLFGEEASPA